MPVCATAALEELSRHFRTSAAYFQRAADGEDDNPVQPDRLRKFVGAGRRFGIDLAEEAELLIALKPVIDAAWTHVARAGALGRTITLKTKFADFTLIARSRTLASPMSYHLVNAKTGRDLFRLLLPVEQGIRQLGLTLSGLNTEVSVNHLVQPPLNFQADEESSLLWTLVVAPTRSPLTSTATDSYATFARTSV